MADARGTAYKERLAALVGLYGEAFILIRSGENKPQVAFITPMADQYVNTFYDANEAVGLIRPTLTLYLVNGEVPVAGDVFFRDGRLFTVRKTHLFRVADVVVVILALADWESSPVARARHPPLGGKGFGLGPEGRVLEPTPPQVAPLPTGEGEESQMGK